MNITVNNISKKFDDTDILKNINLDLKPGKIYGFVGRNGCGKSVLFKIISGFIKPNTGNVIINDIDIYKTNTFPTNTRGLIEKPKFLNELSGLENLKLLASIQNKINEQQIIETLKQVNLYEDKDKKFKKYSLGMKQKLGIAQVLMEDPEIMIFDEPFNGLEEISVKKIRDILIQEKKKGKLILIATHIKDDIKLLCDKVYAMDDGKIT